MTKVLCGGVILILFCAAMVFADTTFVDNQLKFTAYLPNSWVCIAESDSQRLFEDTTYTYPGLLSFTRYIVDSTLYSSADQWTQAHFLGYKLSVEYSVDPSGVVLYSNADTTVKQGSLPAAETYSLFFSSDTAVGSWAEYVRFTAYGKYGYELYAVSDTTDMSNHIGFYAAILQGIVIDPSDKVISPLAFRRRAGVEQKFLSSPAYDPLGRQRRTQSHGSASGMVLRKNTTPQLLLR
jgi:hypothetical protein